MNVKRIFQSATFLLPISITSLYPRPFYQQRLLCDCPIRHTTHYPEKKIHQAFHFCGDVIMDVLRIHKNLFSVTTAQIFTAFTPIYIVSRSIDEDLQSRFYDPGNHKNTCQFPKACHQIARFGVGIPMAFLSSLMFFAPSHEMRVTARVFALGWPFVHFTKDVIKSIDTKGCLRPWHEDFSCTKRSTGGFPSGHMANMTYTATLWGLRYGPKWGIPLSLGAAFVFADFINCNRHYLSQLIAGAGLGVIYAFAVNKVIEKKLSHNIDLKVQCNTRGKPTVILSYLF